MELRWKDGRTVTRAFLWRGLSISCLAHGHIFRSRAVNDTLDSASHGRHFESLGENKSNDAKIYAGGTANIRNAVELTVQVPLAGDDAGGSGKPRAAPSARAPSRARARR